MTALLRTVALVAPRRGRVALSVALGAAAVASAIGLLATSGYLIVRAAERPGILSLTVAIVSVRTFGISRALLRYAERLVTHDLAFRQLAELRERFYARLAPLVPAGLPRLRGGDLLSRFVADVDQLQHLYLRALTPPLVAIAIIALATGAAFVILPVAGVALGVALLVGATVVPLVTHLAARSAARRQAPARAALSAELVEALEGAAELAVLNQEDDRLGRLRGADARLASLVRRDALAGGLATALSTLVAGLAVVAVVAVTIPSVHDGTVRGVLLGLLALLALAAFEGVTPLPAAAQQLAACARSAERLHEVVDAPVPVKDFINPHAVPDGPLTLRAEGVTMAYTSDGEPVLRDVDLTLAAGRAVALIGPSGGGKSTLAQLLVRFRDPRAGRVTLNGLDVRDLRQDDLRHAVLYAAQDAHVFTTSVRENLLLARREATDAELRAALEAVGLDGELTLDQPVGEDGDRLSGGQRRRLLVARALVSDARVLILDEPAAHLDPEAVPRLHERLREEADRGRAVLVIAHVLDGLEGYDQLLALDGGRLDG